MNTDIETGALLVMDVQEGIIDRIAEKDSYLEKMKTAVDAAHKKEIQVVYVVVGFRPGVPEVSTANKMFSALAKDAHSPLINPIPLIESTEGDVVVTKRRVSAFMGSDLEVILSAKNIRHLVLTGIATSGVVLSTLREAADKDFKITVLSDLCADGDAEVQALLTTKVFPRQAEVMTSEEWIEGLK